MKTQSIREVRWMKRHLFWAFSARKLTTLQGSREGQPRSGVAYAVHRPRLTIRQIMHPNPITIRPENRLAQAVELLIANRISGLPVVDGDGTIVGALTEKDLLRVFYEPAATSVESVMTRNPLAVEVDEPLVVVFDYLMANDFRRVLVHRDRKLVGLVTRADLMPAILEVLGHQVLARHDSGPRFTSTWSQH